jgi:tRNA-dihydrouridine synthase 4
MRSSEPVILEGVKLVTEHIKVPKLSNGDVYTLTDARFHTRTTGADGVMSARGLLENPAFFKGFDGCPWEAVEVFMNKVVKAPIPFKLVVHHLSEMVGSDRMTGTVGGGSGTLMTKEERIQMMECGSMIELIDWLDGIREVRRI